MSIQEFKPVKEGKVREVYDIGDSLIITATDRISAFDVILKNKITDKGAILTKMSEFWFDFTKDILPNHMISTDVKDMPEFFQNERFDGNSMKCRSSRCFRWSASCADILQAADGPATRRTVRSAVSGCRKG